MSTTSIKKIHAKFQKGHIVLVGGNQVRLYLQVEKMNQIYEVEVTIWDPTGRGEAACKAWCRTELLRQLPQIIQSPSSFRQHNLRYRSKKGVRQMDLQDYHIIGLNLATNPLPSNEE